MKQLHLDMGIENKFKLGKKHDANASIDIFEDSIVFMYKS
jgi:hypothetical protein